MNVLFMEQCLCLFYERKFEIPVIWSLSVPRPQGLNTLKSGNTQQLDELDELQRGIVMDLSHIVGHQVVESLNNLSGHNIFVFYSIHMHKYI